MKLISFLILSTVLLTTQSCGKKTKKSNSGVHVSTYYIAGDPKAAIKGSTLNRTSFLTLDNFKKFNNFELSGMMTIAEIEKIVTTENIEEGQEATTSNELESDLRPFTFSDGKDFIYLENAQIGFKLRFKVKENLLDLDQLIISNNGSTHTYPVDMLHYSVSSNKETFSLLVAIYEEESGRNLVSFTFVKPTQKTYSVGNTDYKYLAGPGVKVNWDQSKDLVVNICGRQNANVVNTYTAGVNMWTAPLKDRLNLKVQQLTTYPPFSDVNTQCIYNVDSYLTTPPEDQSANPASTIYGIDRYKGRLTDADIIVWNREIEKIGTNYEAYSDMKLTIGHEVGHLLGLHHQFDDKIPSLMGYDGVSYITPYDWNAIQELYPKIK